MPDPVLAAAAAMTPDELRVLAATEARSRAADPPGRLAAHAELADLGDRDEQVARLHLAALAKGDAIAAGKGLTREEECLAGQAIADGAVALRLTGDLSVDPQLSRASRSFLARAWRRCQEDLRTPLTGGAARG